ncbi:hypothetical protein CCACVL1_08441 [Corchorus capsularis]|uniref:Zinc finger, BED-type n=1 Tax=Corchorus capsularis TaxID=210143 RepID=A0A1R3J0K6_COCAP|nr:hypothetical protein CCACVL1_08441 [Corchorus capsularis]
MSNDGGPSSGGGPLVSQKKDPAWIYNFLSNTNDPNSCCIFCQKTTKGGIYQAKQHQVGNFKNAKACLKVPDHVKEELLAYMNEKKTQKENYDKASVASKSVSFKDAVLKEGTTVSSLGVKLNFDLQSLKSQKDKMGPSKLVVPPTSDSTPKYIAKAKENERKS